MRDARRYDRHPVMRPLRRRHPKHPDARPASTWRIRIQRPPVLNGIGGDAILEPLSVSIVFTQPSRWSIADLVKTDFPCRRCGRYPPLKKAVEARPPSARTVCRFRMRQLMEM